MKPILVILSFTLITFQAIAEEQCLVKHLPSRLDRNTVTTITLQPRAVILNGYQLDCETKAPTWCKFKARVNASKTTYTFGDNIVKVKRKQNGALAGTGSFESETYAVSSSAKLKCLKTVPIEH